MRTQRRLFLNHAEDRFRSAIVDLLGHMLGGAVLLAALAFFTWVISLSIARLHGIHPFEPSIRAGLELLDIAILYLDIAICVMVLCGGAYRFVKAITGVRT